MTLSNNGPDATSLSYEGRSNCEEAMRGNVVAATRRVVLVIYLLIMASCLLAMYHYGWRQFASGIFDCTDSSSVAARAIILVPLLIMSTVLFIPVPGFYMLLLGYFCGFWLGAALIFVAELTSLTVSIALVRACGFDPLGSLLSRDQGNFKRLASMAKDLKLLAFFRFMIFIPIPIRNYATAMGDIQVTSVLAVSWPGALYFSSLMAYMGSACHKVIGRVREGDTAVMGDIFNSYQAATVTIVSVTVIIGALCVGYCGHYKKVECEEDAPENSELSVMYSPVADNNEKDQ